MHDEYQHTSAMLPYLLATLAVYQRTQPGLASAKCQQSTGT